MTRMKCSKCGFTCNSIKAMGAHYRKKHPSSMKRRASSSTRNLGRKPSKSKRSIIQQIEGLLERLED